MALAKVSATPDTGAEISVAGLDILQQIGGHVNNLLPVNVKLVTATNEAMQPIGKMEVLLKYGDHSVIMELIVCSDLKGMLLSWIICKDLGILHPSYPEPLPPAYSIGAVSTPAATDSVDQIRLDLISEFRDVFDENGPLRTMAGPPMKILLKEDAIPYAVNGARPISFSRAFARTERPDLPCRTSKVKRDWPPQSPSHVSHVAVMHVSTPSIFGFPQSFFKKFRLFRSQRGYGFIFVSKIWWQCRRSKHVVRWFCLSLFCACVSITI